MNRGRYEDWEVVCIDSESYAIYRKDYNEEWQDEHGDNLAFETAEEAEQYLKGVFNRGVGEMSVRLFDAHGEVRVGDVARYGRKPVIVERFGVDPQLKTPVVHVVTMDERKHFIKLLPYQLGMVVEKDEETASTAGIESNDDPHGGGEWTGAKEGTK